MTDTSLFPEKFFVAHFVYTMYKSHAKTPAVINTQTERTNTNRNAYTKKKKGKKH